MYYLSKLSNFVSKYMAPLVIMVAVKLSQGNPAYPSL